MVRSAAVPRLPERQAWRSGNHACAGACSCVTRHLTCCCPRPVRNHPRLCRAEGAAMRGAVDGIAPDQGRAPHSVVLAPLLLREACCLSIHPFPILLASRPLALRPSTYSLCDLVLVCVFVVRVCQLMPTRLPSSTCPTSITKCRPSILGTTPTTQTLTVAWTPRGLTWTTTARSSPKRGRLPSSRGAGPSCEHGQQSAAG